MCGHVMVRKTNKLQCPQTLSLLRVESGNETTHNMQILEEIIPVPHPAYVRVKFQSNNKQSLATEVLSFENGRLKSSFFPCKHVHTHTILKQNHRKVVRTASHPVEGVVH